MDKMIIEALRLFISSREDAAFLCLDKNPEYAELCKAQHISENAVEEILMQLDDAVSGKILQCSESNVRKISVEMDAVYIQGLRDGYGLIEFLHGKDMLS